MIRYLAATAALLVAAAGPAMGEPIPVDQAVAEVQAAAQAGNASEHFVYRSSSLEGRVEYDAIGQYHWLTDRDDQLIVKNVGNFHRIHFPSEAVRATVAGYLGAPELTWELASDANPYQLLLWDAFEYQDLPGRVVAPYPGVYRAAEKTSVPPYAVYRLYSDKPGMSYAYEYRVDAAGRVTRYSGFDEGSSEEAYWAAWDYAAPVSIIQPAADEYRPIDDVQRAIQAATLNPKIKGMAKRFAKRGRKHSFSVKKMRSWTASMVSYENQVGDGDENYLITRPLPLHSGSVGGGSKIYCRNPYTSTMHAWKIVKRSGAWRAVRMA